MIPEVEVGIAFKMAYSTYALGPYEFVSIGWSWVNPVYYKVKISYFRLSKLRYSPNGP